MHVGAISDESFGTCSQMMSTLEQATMCNNRKPTRKMEKAYQGRKRVKNDEMKTTLNTTIYNNKVLTKKKKSFQRAKPIESFLKNCANKHL